MKYARRAGLALLLLILVAGTLNEISKANCFTLTGHAICRVETDQPLVALTFDDGPTQAGVDSVLPVLKRYGARGTFFLIGDSFFPPYGSIDGPLVRRMVADGHEIGNHSLSHKRMVLHSPSFYDQEIKQTDAILRAAGAPKPTLFRPPYGKKLVGLPMAVERNGYKLIMWDSGDPPDRDPKAYAEKVLAQVRPGSIILIHPMFPSRATERAALPLILEGLKRRGLRSVTVSELIAAGRKPQPAG